MLANFRHSSSLKLIQILFGLIVFVMVASPILSALSSGSQNPVLLKSTHHKVTLKDLFGRDQNLLQTLHKLQASPHSPLAQKSVAQYYRSFSYQDFFTTYGCTLDDGIAWQWFLAQFGEEISAEQYGALELSIRKQFGSRKAFLAQLKPQLLSSKIQEQVAFIMGSPEAKNPALSLPLQHTLAQYNFSPRDYASKAVPESPEVLVQYYRAHLQDYVALASMDLSAQFYQPYNVNLGLVSSARLQAAKAALESLGYTEIDDRLLQKQIFNDIAEDLQARSLRSLQELALLYPEITPVSSQNLSQVSQDQVDSLFSNPGLFTLLQSQCEDRLALGDSSSLPLTALPTGSNDGLWLFAPANYAPAHTAPYSSVSRAVFQDWTDTQAALLAQEAAKAFVQRYQSGEALFDKPHAQIVSDNLLLDSRFPDRVKLQLSHLVSADLDRAQSICTLSDGQRDSGVKVFVLDKVAFTPPPPVDSKSVQQGESEVLQAEGAQEGGELTVSEGLDFNLSKHAHQSAALQAFDRSIDHAFGYQIQPEFWSVLGRFEDQRAAQDRLA